MLKRINDSQIQCAYLLVNLGIAVRPDEEFGLFDTERYLFKSIQGLLPELSETDCRLLPVSHVVGRQSLVRRTSRIMVNPPHTTDP